MPYFDSTAIRRAEYEPATRTLTIWFVGNDDPYDYPAVPSAVFDGLCRADSQGQFFNACIRDSYPGHRRARPRRAGKRPHPRSSA